MHAVRVPDVPPLRARAQDRRTGGRLRPDLRRRHVAGIVGTLTYSTSQDWSLINGFYFAIATLTTSSIADPSLTIESGWIKAFTVIYILVGIGILVELARQVGFAFVEVHRQDQAARQAKKDAKHHAEPA